MGASEWQRPKIPLLLIPGIAGSMLQSNELTPKKLWLSYPLQEEYGNEYLSTIFDPFTETIQSRFGYEYVTTPNENHGICSIENIGDNGLESNSKSFREMIQWAICLGYIPGETLFGFPYDWRQSIRHVPIQERLKEILMNISSISPTRKVDVISHSSGGLILKYLLGNNENAVHYIRKWIPIATPWIGSSVLGYKSLLFGYDVGVPFIQGLGGLSEQTALQLEMGWPLMFELLPDLNSKEYWGLNPSIKFNLNGSKETKSTESEVFDVLKQTHSNNIFIRKTTNESYPQPLDENLWRYSKKTKEKLRNFDPKSFKEIHIFNIVGKGLKTNYSVLFENVVNNVLELKNSPYVFEVEDGDNLIPIKSSLAHGMIANTYSYIGNHDEMLKSKEIFNGIRSFLDLACIIEGTWKFTAPDDSSLPGQFELFFNHTKKVKKIDYNLNEKDSLVEIEYLDRKGIAKIDSNCMTINLVLGNDHIVGKRIIGGECSLNDIKQVDTMNGVFVQHCIYGFWSTHRTLTCHSGYKNENDACHREKPLSRTVLIVLLVIGSILGVFILFSLGYIKLRYRSRSHIRMF